MCWQLIFIGRCEFSPCVTETMGSVSPHTFPYLPTFMAIVPPPEMFEGTMELGLLEAASLTAAREAEFEPVEYPPRLPSTVNLVENTAAVMCKKPRIPLDTATFQSFFDEDGRIVNEHLLRQAAFKGLIRLYFHPFLIIVSSYVILIWKHIVYIYIHDK